MYTDSLGFAVETRPCLWSWTFTLYANTAMLCLFSSSYFIKRD